MKWWYVMLAVAVVLVLLCAWGIYALIAYIAHHMIIVTPMQVAYVVSASLMSLVLLVLGVIAVIITLITAFVIWFDWEDDEESAYVSSHHVGGLG